MDLSLLLVYTATAFVVSFLFFPVLIKLLTKWEVFDSPTDRKVHQTYKPSMGGVSILLGVGFSLLIALPFHEWISRKYFFIGLALMFITGLRDDILTLKPSQKLISQILPIIILVVFGDTLLSSLYGIWPGVEIPRPVAWVVTIFTIVILTNAYNLIDGLDGLAGAVGLLATLIFGSWFYLASLYALSLIAFSFSGALFAFLIFNWQPSRIFMGDTGALVIGLLLAYLAVAFINENYFIDQNYVQGADISIHFRSSISTALCVLIIPVFDTLRVIILRVRKLQSPFRADKNHLHHQFLNLGFSHSQAVLSLMGINIFFVLLAVIFRNSPDALILPIVIGICIAINFALKVAKNKYERDRGKSIVSPEGNRSIQ